MALELILQNNGFYPYRDCTEPIVGGPYYTFCTGPSVYRESILQLESFVYDAATDRYYLYATHTQVDWPSWSIWKSVIHPETGVIESHVEVNGAVGFAWTSNMYNGGLNKTYAQYLNAPLVEINPAIGIPTASQIANPVLTAAQIPEFIYTQYAVVTCPERKLVTLFSAVYNSMVVYDYSNYPGVSVELWRQPFTELYTWGVGYENDRSLWALFSYDVSTQ
jgi:hypothetical protein